MPAAVPRRRTAAAALGLLALGAVSLLPWWQQWTAPDGVRSRVDGWNVWQASTLAAAAVVVAAVAVSAAARFPAAGDSRHLLADGSSYRQLGFGAFLGAALVVAVAVVLTLRALHRHP